MTYTLNNLEAVRRMTDKTEVRRSQSFTFTEISVGLEILKYAMRANDLKLLAQRSDFISLYRKFARMKEKMAELKEAREKAEE